MRWCAITLLLTTVAHADGEPTIRVRRLERPSTEPLLHLNTPLAADAEGGLVDSHTTVLEIGQRAQLATEARWWKSGLAPSMFENDLANDGWRAAAELSYDLGPFTAGVNASRMKGGDTSHRMVGLFGFRKFRLSRWTNIWIVLGVSYEEFQFGSTGTGGVSTGLKIGGTFR